MLDWQDIGSQVVVMVVGAVGSWAVGRLRKARRDMNAAFRKIREIEKKLGLDLNEKGERRGTD